MKTDRMNTYYGDVRWVLVPHGASVSCRWMDIDIIHSGVRTSRVDTRC